MRTILNFIIDKLLNATPCASLKYFFLIFFLSVNSKTQGAVSIGTTRPIPPNRRSCLGCIWWKDMSNPKRLR